MKKIGIFIFFSLLGWSLLAKEKVQFQSSNKQANLIELFTSQGCSSCPPAEKWINSFLIEENLWKEVVPVAFHVDYWDYLGWKDIYAKKQFTNLQKTHYKNRKLKSIYTPSILINGVEWRGGKLPQKFQATGIISGIIENQQIEVRYSESKEHLVLHIALLGFGIQTNVLAGENANHILPQEFLVLDYQELDNKNSSKTRQWTFPLPQNQKDGVKKLALAIWISDKERQILQATGFWL